MNLITGGTGFLGEELISRLSDQSIRVLSRNEGKLVALKDKYPDIEIVTGDIADEWTVKKAMRGINKIYHLAAFKHVGLAESNVLQCISSNIVGSLNIVKESLVTKPKLVIGISTDKAAQVKGIYGATKMCMEGLFKEAETINSQTKYRIVRYGNVLYSTGSVLCKWIEAIKNKRPIVINNPESTRFYWTREQAIDHIFRCIENAESAVPYITEMKAIKLGDLLEATRKKYGQTKVVQGEMGATENLHETIDGKTYSNQVKQLTVEEIMAMI